MLSSQYSIALPADYDMQIIRQRIATRGYLTDGMAGLFLKAYLFAEAADPGTPGNGNLYAPFYLWQHAEGLQAFLTGPGFTAVCTSFGRPAITVAHAGVIRHSANVGMARMASRQIHPLEETTSLAGLADQERAWLGTLPDTAVLALSALDTDRWATIRFILWDGTPPRASGTQVYRVGHLSYGAAYSTDSSSP